MKKKPDDFEQFFAENFDRVRRALLLMGATPVQAEDAAEEALARAFVQWSKVRRMERPVGWLITVATNVERSSLRRAKRLDSIKGGPNTASVIEPSDVTSKIDIDRALLALTERQRTVVVLRYYAQLQTKEISKAMRCAEGTVKATLHAALQKLRVELPHYEERTW